MSDLLTDKDLKTERAREPAKRWRNRYEVCCGGGVTIGDDHWRSGERKWGRDIFPSAELAEQHALNFITNPKWTPPLDPGDLLWLGAFPESETP